MCRWLISSTPGLPLKLFIAYWGAWGGCPDAPNAGQLPHQHLTYHIVWMPKVCIAESHAGAPVSEGHEIKRFLRISCGPVLLSTTVRSETCNPTVWEGKSPWLFLARKGGCLWIINDEALHTCPLCFSNTPTLPPQGLYTRHSLVLELLSQLCKRPLVVLRCHRMCHGPRDTLLLLPRPLPPALPSPSRCTGLGEPSFPPASLCQSSNHSLQLSCHLFV